MPLFRVLSTERRLQPFIATDLGSQYQEVDLENWIESNPQVLLQNEPILVIGRQVSTPVGIIDLLGLDSSGAGVIIELKRAPSQREAIAQALEYASWLAGLEGAGLREIAVTYLHGKKQGPSLEEAWTNTFATELAQLRLNSQQRVFVVIEGQDDRLRSVAEYLRTSGVDISLVTYSFYKTESGEELLDLKVEIGPEEDAATAESKPSEAGLLGTWDAPAVDAYTAFKEVMVQRGLILRPQKTGISFVMQTSEGPVFVCFFNSTRSSIGVWLRSDSLSLIFDFADAAKAMKARLPHDVAVKHSHVWFRFSFSASTTRASEIAQLVVAEVVAKLDAGGAA
jgi:hypothetical protein